ncbi:MAG TPA: VWA domain-containing protein [Bryobacteraceae bacterium]|jgi:VWFA-related protein|nr:VWA domain-containing protein [Bryobacteraceae bacterium]
MRITLLVSATLLAQQNVPDPTVFQSQAREVLLEVVVRDAHGKLITKVDPAQVSVFEDGVKQDIRSFRLVPGREVRAQAPTPAPAPATAEAGAAAVVPVRSLSNSQPNPLRTVNVVCLILNDLTPETRGFAFDAAKKFVKNELRPDTYIGVFSLDARGLRPVFPFSNNRDNLLKAVELAAVNQLATIAQSSASVLNGLSMSTLGVSLNSSASTAIVATPGAAPGASVTAAPPPGVPTAPDGSNIHDPLGTRGDIGVAVNAGLREIDALIGMVKQLGQLPFQKTVLLMSTGLTRPPDQLERWNSLISQANAGGVTFYGVDVYGLGVCQDAASCPEGTSSQGGSPAIQGSPVTTPTSASVALTQSTAGMSQGQSTVGLGRTDAYKPGGSSTQGPSPAAQAMESMHQTDYLRFAVLSANTQEALREISESTGGFVIANTNNTEALLTKVMEEVDTHFELAYRPAAPSNDGHFRKITVKVSRADLRVETRSGYYAVPDTGEGPLTAGDMGALEALDRNPLPYDFGFESKAFRFRSAKGSSQYAIAFEVPIANLTATAAGNAKHKFHAYLMALVKDAQGEIVERVSKDVPSDVADKYLAGLRGETMIYEHAVNLKPGKYTVETAVVDQEGKRVSTGVFPLENVDHQGLGVSDITLVRRVHDLARPAETSDPFEVPGKRAQPFLSSTLEAGTQPYIYFVVYPEPETLETALLKAQFLKDGKVVATQRSALPAADATGAVPMTMQPVAAAGDYEVKITVEQGRGVVEGSLKYRIEGK